MDQLLPGEEAFEVLQPDLADTDGVERRHAGGVGGDEQVGDVPEVAVGGPGLGGQHVDEGLGDAAGGERTPERLDVDQRAAPDIDQRRGGLHPGERPGPDHAGGLAGVGNGEDHEIRLGQERGEVVERPLPVEPRHRFGRPADSVHRHAERARIGRDAAPDGAEPDDQDRRRAQPGLLELAPLMRALQVAELGQPLRAPHHAREGELRDFGRVGAGAVGHRHPLGPHVVIEPPVDPGILGMRPFGRGDGDHGVDEGIGIGIAGVDHDVGAVRRGRPSARAVGQRPFDAGTDRLGLRRHLVVDIVRRRDFHGLSSAFPGPRTAYRPAFYRGRTPLARPGHGLIL